MLYPLHAMNINASQVCGRSDLTLRLKIIKTFLSFIPIGLGIYFNDIYWLLWGGVVVNAFSYYLNAYYSKDLIEYPVLEQIKDVMPSFLIALAAAFLVHLMNLIPVQPVVLLILQLTVGFFLVVIINETVRLSEYCELKGIIMKSFARIKKRKQ